MRTCEECKKEKSLDNYYPNTSPKKCKKCYSKINNTKRKCDHGRNRNLCPTCDGRGLCISCKKRQILRKGYSDTLCRSCYIEQNRGSDIVLELLDKGSSKGEKKITKILKKKGVEFKAEYTFTDQGDFDETISRCRYDFYLPKHNTIIEYHGRQHYNYTPYFHRRGIMDFFNSIHRDFLKKIYCYSKGMKFIEIKYNENIEEKLTEIK